MGRARGATIRASAADSFSVFGTRRGSPEMQARRDQLEAADVRASFIAALTGPSSSNFTDASRIIRRSGLATDDPIYQELAGIARQRILELDALGVAAGQLDDMTRDGSLHDGDGDFLANLLCRRITGEQRISQADAEQLLVTIMGPLPEDPDFEIGDADHKPLIMLASAYCHRLQGELDNLRALRAVPSLQDAAEAAAAERFGTLERILRLGKRVTPGGRNLERLSPLVFIVKQDIAEGGYLTGPQIQALYAHFTGCADPYHWALTPLRDTFHAVLPALADGR